MRLGSALIVALLCLSVGAADDTPPPSGAIAGKVVNQKGDLMPEVPLKLYLPRGMKTRPPTTQPIKGRKEPYIESATDSQGRFVFDKLPPGEYVVIAELDGTGRGRVEVVVQANKVTRVQVMLVSRRGETQ